MKSRGRPSRSTPRRPGSLPLTALALLLAALSAASPAATAQPRRQATQGDVRLTSVRSRALPSEIEARGITIDSEARRLCQQLADPSWNRREEAMQALLNGAADVDQLCAILEQETLSAEQQYRVLAVLRQQLLTAPRGAVGIRVDQRWLPNVVVIEELLPDLPAAKVLQVGDRITHLQGVPLRSWTDFRRTVQFLAPGDRIAMTIERPVQPANDVDAEQRVPTRTMNLDLRLGSADKLVNPDTGLPQRDAEVERARLSEANAASRRYRPRPRPVDVRGENADDLFSPRAITDVEVQGHPALVALRRDHQQLAEGRLEDTPQLRHSWELQLRQLHQLARDPDLTPRDAELIGRVAQWYEKLMRNPR